MTLPKFVLRSYAARTLHRLPDRVFLHGEGIDLIRRVAPRKLLSVGVHYYTAYFQEKISEIVPEVWTIDIDREKARWGSRGHHIVGDALEVNKHFPPGSFDVVVFNGVLGFGIDGQAESDLALRKIAALLRPGGTLLFGWTRHVSRDPSTIPAVAECFVSVGRTTFTDSPHVYDVLQPVGS